MHKECIQELNNFIDKYLDKTKTLEILDVGSRKAQSRGDTFRESFSNQPLWNYTGVDICKGKNVDIVTKNPYEYPFKDKSFNVVISGNTLEHIQDLHKIIKEMARITKDYIFIIVPNTFKIHRYPIDCWRIFPDGMNYLLKDIAGLKVLESRVGGTWGKLDTVGIAKKI